MSTRNNKLNISLIIFLTLLVSITLYSQEQNITYKERAANAKIQLEEYKKFLKLESNQSISLSPLKSEVGIEIDFKTKKNTSSTIFLYDNMESGTSNWLTHTYSGSNLWHQTNLDASSQITSWWCGDEINQHYNTGSRVNNALISPSINLIGATGNVNLIFTEKYETEKGWDFCMVDVTTNGGNNWIKLRGVYGTAPNGSSEGWIISKIDLTPYINNEIKIRFYFDTGDSLFNQFPGWFVDDVLIYSHGGMITGNKFFDFNQNGFRDGNDKGIKNWLITAEGNGIKLTAKTNIRGKYWIPLPLGTYTIREIPKPNWIQTSPLGGEYIVNLTSPDTLVDSLNFGNYTPSAILSGVKFHDLNNNGIKDVTDTLLPNWKIWMYSENPDSGIYEEDYTKTDSSGEYNFFVLSPGRYYIRETEKYGWQQTFPETGEYSIEIQDLQTNYTDLDFGNFANPYTDFVSGYKFNDRNRNGVRDTSEEGLSNFTIKLMKASGNQFINFRHTITDSNGFYTFTNLIPRVYKICEVPQTGWWQSLPDSCYIVNLESETIFDTLNFGNYQIGYSSVSGVKFNDINGNGLREESEPGLSGWTIVLTGTSIYNNIVNLSAVTNSEGNYRFDNLWPGKYLANESMKNNWRQTYPDNYQPHFINLGLEENFTRAVFGNTFDTTFSLALRTFLPDSFALGRLRPVKLRPDKMFWKTISIKPNDYSITDSIKQITFFVTKSIIASSLTVSKPCSIVADDLNKVVKIYFQPYLQPQDSVKISGLTWTLKQQFTKWWNFEYADSIGTKRYMNLIAYNEPRFPMPNGTNILEAGAGTNLKVGVGGPHTVLHRNYKDVIKSLVDAKTKRMHIGDARCLDKFTNGASIKRQQKFLTPSKGNNKLFAEAVALQANIKASDLGITPGGFGSLIFNEGNSSPLNGMTIRGIASVLDLYMSSYDDLAPLKQCQMPTVWNGLSPETLYTKIRLINNAFCGPIDTISFATGLKLKPVRPLSAVPFLSLDSSNTAANIYSIIDSQDQLPDRFILSQNYPNPFNPSTIIEFYLPEESYVTLEIFNVLGQKVAVVLKNQEFEDGWQEIEMFNSDLKLASGIYYYKMTTQTKQEENNKQGIKYSDIKKMVLIK